MGVYIKSMEMPKSCFYCPFREKVNVNPNDYVCMAMNREVEETFALILGRRHKDCPLVEVPDHGDLVDRGALEDTVLRLNFPEEYPSDDVEESWEITRSQYKLIDNVLFEMPVVIPADKEE